jgi:protein-export membrane protein SecD
MRYSTWQIALILLVAAFGVIFTLPNFIGRTTLERLPDWVPKRQITLGLDLQGGSYLLLEVDTNTLVKDKLDSLVGDIRAKLRQERIGYRGLGVQGDAVLVTLTDPAQNDAALSQLKELNPVMTAVGFGATSARQFAIDSAPNGKITIELTDSAQTQLVQAAVTQSLEVVRRRIDELGTREPTIQRQGTSRILVQVPGEKDPENIKRLLGKTARLTFHMVDMNASVQAAEAGNVPPGDSLLQAADDNNAGPRHYLVEKRVELSGENLTDAQPTFQNGEPVVSFRLDSEGARKFGHITQENVGKLFAIVLDDKVNSAPRIREPILGGSGVISGSFTTQSANDLALLLRAGALPAPLTVLEERTVGPDLGADSIRAGAIASVLAVVLVVAFMLLYYGLFGFFADIALFVNLFLILAALSLLGATLTLPGIAGIVLTIGMAVDSNVLIFERIREELRHGRSGIAAIDTGFREALRTVIDANVTTLIAGVVLFQFGTGPIKGFAVTLSIGIITTLFTAVTFTRLIIWYWYKTYRPKVVPI